VTAPPPKGGGLTAHFYNSSGRGHYIKMRKSMTDEEFLNWKSVVKCNWRKCAGGIGLAGNGCCSFGGDYHKSICPKFIDEDEYEKKWKEKDTAVKKDG
jgi:hypothetical protein